MSALPEWYATTLEYQLRMNSQTWEALQGHGVDEQSLLRLDFVYAAPGEAEARKLAAFIQAETDYDVSTTATKSGLLGKKSWAVVGSTQPTTVSRSILDDWVRWMVLAGAEQGGCEFDGWGAQAG